ncbi:hypothetical protein Btru_073166 [Bulinus truncatus]|nr:hypothetical protein Btru_073166 [Bulinus truncatus]
MQCTSAGVSERYLCYRGIFFKTLKLLSLGISLIFVMDGPIPPPLKRHKKNRDFFYQSCQQYKELLLAMGLPVIECSGEAEKLCAELNRKKIVDGVITDDSDAFVYGGLTIYKGVFSKHKERFAERYRMNDILTTLKLTHRDLVAYALMNHGDFTDGVPNVGEKTFMKLMEEFKNNHIDDALTRLQLWKANHELASLEFKKQEMLTVKIKHCTRCSKQLHSKQGCPCCQTVQTCTEIPKGGNVICPCHFHCLEKQVTPFTTEMKIRNSALQFDCNFPNNEVIKEYLEADQIHVKPSTQMHWPDFPRLFAILENIMRLTPQQLMNYLLPAYIKSSLCGTVPLQYAEPLKLVEYMLNLDDYLTVEDKTFLISVPEHMFATRYPEMAQKYTGPNELKRKAEPTKPISDQRKITQYFMVKK